jgi:peroxiredoxin
MIASPGTAAPVLTADAFVRGEERRPLDLSEFRGTWVVLAFAAGHADVLELAELEEAFAADGAVVLAASADDWHELEQRYGAEPAVRFPILAGVEEHRRMTAIVDPAGVIRYVGRPHSARKTLALLEALVAPALRVA